MRRFGLGALRVGGELLLSSSSLGLSAGNSPLLVGLGHLNTNHYCRVRAHTIIFTGNDRVARGGAGANALVGSFLLLGGDPLRKVEMRAG